MEKMNHVLDGSEEEAVKRLEKMIEELEKKEKEKQKQKAERLLCKVCATSGYLPCVPRKRIFFPNSRV